jgi:flagellar FliJ protein
MAKVFEFRLEKILELRRLLEDAAQREFAVAQNAVAGQNQTILGLMTDEDEMKKSLRAAQQPSIHVPQLRLAADGLVALERRLHREYDALQTLVKVEIEKRRLLTEARKAVRVLERLRERQLLLHCQELDRQERKVLDEIGQNLAKGA